MVLEGGAAVGWGQVGRLDIAELEARFGQGGEQQVVAAGGLGHRDLLAFQVGDAAQRRVAPHDDRLGTWRRCFLGEIGELCASRLGEHRHGVGDIGGQVDIADVECFQQRLAVGELVPADLDVLLGQRLLQGALAFQQADQGRGFLVADAQLAGGFGDGRAKQAYGQAEGDQGTAGGAGMGHGRPRQ
ncbi:hypothetical protein FQZ97_1007700 [compost metagenome]